MCATTEGGGQDQTTSTCFLKKHQKHKIICPEGVVPPHCCKMSCLNKLSILGIRSFDNRRAETIKFYTPLTLIVGYNGSGKTTIIESLKFAFTGVQPPNTKVGGAFVHDPKLAGEKEIMAQVKVSFRAATGTHMVVTRNLQLTVKKTARSLKSLEGALNITNPNTGEITVISSRVAELDMVLPQYLGVSTAVIDNVIFCHQDESLWPLSDPSTLKKKFDEIFEAQKYTKAIDNIKKIRKSQNEELAKYKILEEHAKQDKDRAEKAQKSAERLQQEVEALRAQVEDLERRIAQARKLADEAWRKGESYSKILGTLEGKRIEARSKQNTIRDLEAHLKEVSESDEWLQSTLAQFDTRQQELQDQMRRMQEEYVQCQDRIKLLGKQREEKVQLKGKFEQEKEEFERQIVRRKNVVRETATKHQIWGYDDLEDETLVEEFIYKIKKLSKDHSATFDRTKLEHTSDRRDAQSLVNKLTERKAALQDHKITVKQQMAQNDRDAGEFQRRVNDIKVDEGSKAVIESRIDDLNLKIQTARDVAASADWEKKLADANTALRSSDEESSRLNDEIVQSTKKTGELAKLAHLKQELKERQHSVQTLINAHGQRIRKLIGEAWDATTIEKVHQDVLTDANREMTSAERERDHVGRELEQLQFKQKTFRDDLVRKKTEAETHDKEIRAVVESGPNDYDDALKDAEDFVETTRKEGGGRAGLHDYFLRTLEALNGEKPACRTCLRGFKGPTDPALVRMKRRIEELVTKARDEMQQSDVQEAEQDYKRLLDLAVPYENWKKLTNIEIPAAEAEMADLALQRETLLRRIEKHDKIVEERREAKDAVDAITRMVASISRCDADIRSLTTQIEELSLRQSQQSGGRTLEEIREELSRAAERSRTAQKTISRLRAEQDQSRTDLSIMELELRDLRMELNTINNQLEKKASLASRVEEYRAAHQQQRETLEKIDVDMEKLDPEISTAKAKYDDVDQRAAAKERELLYEQSRLAESVNALDLLNDQIRSYVDRGGPGQLTVTDRELHALERELDQAQSEQGRLTREMNKVNDQIRDGESTRRQFSDNLRYRQETKALHQLNEEIAELASHNAEFDRDRFQTESRKYENEHNKWSAEQSGLMGEMKSKDAQLLELLADYETDFQDAPKRYKEAHIKVEATKAAVEDLARYGGALDKAIMKFHSLKMEEINGIIEELWHKTYQGTDIDTILIRADNETGRGNRSYNYRVVMIKSGAEMDMRGRCSAGQKVLASIIIRLALAECFSANCGLIALDEPTTNLDSDNIRGLAEALHGIIKQRQQQSNFQLIVITHDEEFLKHMQCGDFADYYYRVSRNAQANSIIERQSIAAVL